MNASALRLQALLDAMPPARALGIRAERCDEAGVVLSAPLALNVNDKGCAFGGSLAGLLTLAAWATLEHALHAHGRQAEVYVADSQIDYLAPLHGDLRAEAAAPDPAALAALLRRLAERGRGGIALEARVVDADGRPVATLRGRYAAIGAH